MTSPPSHSVRSLMMFALMAFDLHELRTLVFQRFSNKHTVLVFGTGSFEKKTYRVCILGIFGFFENTIA